MIERGSKGFNSSVPSIARVYDYWLGGGDNYAADRQLADELTQTLPSLPIAARANREFLRRAVTYLAEQGIDQFLDIGAGLPTAGNVHEIAQGIIPGARTVYVDNDPHVFVHGDALLADGCTTEMVLADLLQPQAILGHPTVRKMIDSGRPVALLLVAVLHFIPEPYGIVTELRGALPAGSYLVISHAEARPEDPAYAKAARRYARQAAAMALRRREDIGAFFRETELLEPGLVPVTAWRPHLVPATPKDVPVLGGVGRKPT